MFVCLFSEQLGSHWTPNKAHTPYGSISLFCNKQTFTPRPVVPTYGNFLIKKAPFGLDGVTIAICNEAKYLGITLNSKLNFETHMRNKANAARKTIYMARTLVYKRWGPTPMIMRAAYKTIVRPKIDYACHIWQHKKGRAVELERVQR